MKYSGTQKGKVTQRDTILIYYLYMYMYTCIPRILCVSFRILQTFVSKQWKDLNVSTVERQSEEVVYMYIKQ